MSRQCSIKNCCKEKCRCSKKINYSACTLYDTIRCEDKNKKEKDKKLSNEEKEDIMMKLLEIENTIHPKSKSRFAQKYSCKLESPKNETPRSCKEKQLEDFLNFGPDNCYQVRGYPMYPAPRSFQGSSECRESPDNKTCSLKAANLKGNFSDAKTKNSVSSSKLGKADEKRENSNFQGGFPKDEKYKYLENILTNARAYIRCREESETFDGGSKSSSSNKNQETSGNFSSASGSYRSRDKNSGFEKNYQPRRGSGRNGNNKKSDI